MDSMGYLVLDIAVNIPVMEEKSMRRVRYVVFLLMWYFSPLSEAASEILRDSFALIVDI